MSKRTKLRAKADRERTAAKVPIDWGKLYESAHPKPIIINQLGAHWPLGITIKE